MRIPRKWWMPTDRDRRRTAGRVGAREFLRGSGGRELEMPPVPVADFFIDTNHHMNNGKYILVAKESVPEDFCNRRRGWAEYRRAR